MSAFSICRAANPRAQLSAWTCPECRAGEANDETLHPSFAKPVHAEPRPPAWSKKPAASHLRCREPMQPLTARPRPPQRLAGA